MDDKATDNSESSRDAVVRLVTEYQRRLFAYIYTLVPNRADAEDLLQETCVVIHRKFDDFELGTNFFSWACQIAFWKVCDFRKKKARSKVVFAQAMFDVVAQDLSITEFEADQKFDSLVQCLGQLAQRDKDFILSRYESDGGVAKAAKQSGRSLPATYKALARIRRTLGDCVEQKMLQEGG